MVLLNCQSWDITALGSPEQLGLRVLSLGHETYLFTWPSLDIPFNNLHTDFFRNVGGQKRAAGKGVSIYH